MFSSTLFFSFVAVSLLLWWLHQCIQSRRLNVMVNKLPGPWALPFIGHLHLLIGHLKPHELLQFVLDQSKYYEEEGIAKVWMGPLKPVLGLIDPHDIELILSSNFHLDKSTEYRWFQPWLGDGLLINTGEKWRAHRRLIAPTFHLNVLKSFMPRFNGNAVTLVDRLRKEAEKGTEFDVHDYMSESTVDVLLETVMGVQKAYTGEHAGLKYAVAVMKMCDIVHQRTYKFWLYPDCIFQFSDYAKKQFGYLETIHGLSDKLIFNKKEQLEKMHQEEPKAAQPTEDADNDADISGTFLDSKGYIKDDLDDDVGEKKRLAFLEHMLDTKKSNGNLTDGEIKDEVNTILFEGHDTTAAGSSFMLCLLGIHQDVQAKVVEELHEIFGDSDRPATFNDTLQMKYLERVILETLRMYPPVPLIARTLKHDVELRNGYVLPADCTVVIGIYKLHRHPKYYSNPNEFNPDNFLPEQMAKRHYYSYIPFSAGPRSCVGRKYAMLSLKVMLSTLLRNYKVQSNVTEQDFVLRGDIILKREDGFRMILTPRSSMKTDP